MTLHNYFGNHQRFCYKTTFHYMNNLFKFNVKIKSMINIVYINEIEHIYVNVLNYRNN